MADESGWEVLAIPPEVQHSSKTKNATQNNADDGMSAEGENKDDRLCGYLNKYGARGIRTWKKRWFVFEPRRCTLYYYRTPECTEPLGHIDIATSTFSLLTNAVNKGQFEIRCGDRTYQLQAADKETMQFWLQQLKAERSKFVRLQCSMPGNQGQHTSVLRPTSGLLSVSEDDQSYDISNDVISFADPVKRPATVGESAKRESGSLNQSLSNISLTNLKTDFNNWRKSAIITGEPATADSKNENGEKSPPGAVSGNKDAVQKNVKLREARPSSRNLDFGFAKMTARLKRQTFWGGVSRDVLRPVSEPCRDCEEANETLSILKEAIQIAEQEINTRDEVIASLHEQLRHAVITKPQSSTRAEEDPESLEEKDSYIEKISNMLRKQKAQNEETQLRLDEKNNRISEQNEKIDVLQEMIETKDENIIFLTNKIYAIENPEPAADALEETGDTAGNQGVIIKDISDNQDLKETCDAYVEKNKFLNSEILELFQMRKHDKDIIKEKEIKITSLEAELCKIKSRYVILLKEFSSPLKDGFNGKERNPELIQHLLDDAINTDASNESTERNKMDGAASRRASDRYGFYDIIDTEDDDSLESLAERLEEKSTETMHGTLEMSVGVRWENYLVAQGKKPIVKADEVKSLVRAGVPHEFRARVWQDVINTYIYHEREIAGPGYYQSLLDEKRGVFTPDAKQIEVDLLRTLPNNKYYDHVDSEGTSKLRNVLLAYSWHNPTVGYCQGLNRLGAIALLYLKEEDAFWCLIAIVEHLMPRDYYTKTLIGAQIDQRVFKELLDEKLPKLSALFQNLQIDLSLLSFNWFLAIFVDIFPVELTLRVWDTFLYEGNKVLFRYSLAIFKSCEDDLLKMKDSGEVFAFFRRLPSSRTNPHRISQMAFHQMNPFPKRNIFNKRAYYKPKLEAELAEFEAMRQDKKSERNSSKSTDKFSDCEDED